MRFHLEVEWDDRNALRLVCQRLYHRILLTSHIVSINAYYSVLQSSNRIHRTSNLDELRRFIDDFVSYILATILDLYHKSSLLLSTITVS